MAGTICTPTPAARARSTTARRSASNSEASRWQWLSTSCTASAFVWNDGGLRRRILASLPVGQQQGAEAEQDLVHERDRVGQQQAHREQRRGDLEQGRVPQLARPGQQRRQHRAGHVRGLQGKKREDGRNIAVNPEFCKGLCLKYLSVFSFIVV